MNQKAKDRIKDELDAVDTEQAYRDMLNEMYPEVDLCGSIFRGRSAEMLEEHSPTDFRCGHVDWVDSELRNYRWFEVDDVYYNFKEAQDIIDEVDAEEEEPEEDE